MSTDNVQEFEAENSPAGSGEGSSSSSSSSFSSSSSSSSSSSEEDIENSRPPSPRAPSEEASNVDIETIAEEIFSHNVSSSHPPLEEESDSDDEKPIGSCILIKEDAVAAPRVREEIPQEEEEDVGNPGKQRKKQSQRGIIVRETEDNDQLFLTARKFSPDYCVRESDADRCKLYKKLFTAPPPLGYELLAPTIDDRIYDTAVGLGLYSTMIEHGFRLPLTAFRRDLLTALSIAPSQLHSNAWWIITAFEAFFTRNAGYLQTDSPTVGSFLYYYKVQLHSSDWLTVKTRPKRTKLIDTRDEPKYAKANRWNHHFYFLECPDSCNLMRGIRFEWRVLPEKPFQEPSFNVDPGLIKRIERLVKGNLMY